MSCATFQAAVEASFNAAAVDVQGGGGKVIDKPGVAGLHEFLEGCRGKALRCG